MYRKHRTGFAAEPDNESPPSPAHLFALALLGKPIPSPSGTEAEAQRNRALLEWLASISTEHERESRSLLSEEAAARHQRDLGEWLAAITDIREADWDPAKHPRRGTPPNPGWFASTGGTSSGTKSPPFLDSLVQRNLDVARLTGGATPEMRASDRLASDLEALLRTPGEAARAMIPGLGTGAKAVVNGTATAIKNVATLGLSTRQLELIGVTQADRDRGYDTAVTIATASGEVLIAVGTGGIAAALSKGGTVARTAGGALVAFDAAGNAVGVIHGVYDAIQNGVNVRNGTNVAAGLLGLGANISAARALRNAPDVDGFISKLPRENTPTKSVANQYEIKHTGPHNYTISGGGATFKIDGYRGTTILEAKHVHNLPASPYIPGSKIPDRLRTKILGETRGELIRARKIIKSGTTPFKSVEIITNSPHATTLFEEILKELALPGKVVVKP